MVDKYTTEKKYDYDINANKVVNNDRDAPQRDNEPSGEPETLVGRKLHPFGDLAQRTKPPKKGKKKEGVRPKETSKKKDISSTENLLYKPKTKDTNVVYEELLGIVHKYLLDEPPSYIKSALDVIIAEIKTENVPENDKRENIKTILGERLTNEETNKMFQLCKNLVDFDSYNSGGTGDNKELEMNVEFGEGGNSDEEMENDEEMSYSNDEDIDQEMKIKGNEAQIIDKDTLNKESGDLLNVQLILGNAFWLQNYLREKLLIDDTQVLKFEKDILDTLKLNNARECENKLVVMLKRENFTFIKFLLVHKNLVYYSVKLGRAQDQKEKDEIIKEMCATKEGYDIYDKILNSTKTKKKTSSLLNTALPTQNVKKEQIEQIIKTNYNLEDLQFSGSHFNSNKKIILPKGTFKESKAGYDEITIPPQENPSNNKIKEIKVSSLPAWMHAAFQYKDEENNVQFINDTFNKVQSKVLNSALNTDDNLLICAPTSSGKTNIALMTILRLISHYRNEETSAISLKQFKIVYIAPMKALVKETVGNFSQRLSQYNLTVKELSGDINLSKYEIESTNVIVTTPEKWDIITRKASEKTFTEKVKLVIIDEIHLLHDTRGAVLEGIIARTMMKSNETKDKIRLVALSATLPNYKDVAEFCHVDKKKGLFYFDNSYRPIPLEQVYIGITEKKGIKKLLLLNEITYEKVAERITQGKQIIIFVHSRKETIRTGNNLLEFAKKRNELNKFSLSEAKQNEFNQILESDISNNMIKDEVLLSLMRNGIGVHHAGMSRSEKEVVEEYFNNGYLHIIVSTATLAWGVNLPAHTVIIKGTQVYDPEQGQWVELSHLDIMQMMGRAGRVGYGSPIGEGIIITSFNELQYYLSLLNQQLPIESQMIRALPDTLNAEIAAGNVCNINEGVNWLSFTYLYIRMMRSPNTYTITDSEKKDDEFLVKRRTDLIHSSALLLQKHGLIKYNDATGEMSTTQLGKVSSYYYIKYQSIGTYNANLNPNMNIIDLFRLFSLSNEFKLIPIREEEKKEVEKLVQKVPIPVKGSNDEPSSKINVLLQAYISNISLEGYAISSDMVYISQNASRIFRALFEICTKRAWAALAQICLNVCKMVRLRMWSIMSPLRQFGIVPNDILHKIESKEQLTWERFYDLSSTQISELIKINKKNAEGIHKLIHTFPRVDLTANIQPLTRNCIYVELIIVPNFKWNSNYHKHSELFHIFVEDNDSEVILHYETFNFKAKDMMSEDSGANEKRISFIVPMIEPTPPQYFIRVVSENWLNCEKLLAVYFKHLILPEKFPPYTNLLDLHPLNYNGTLEHKIEQYYSKKFKTMNSIQTQCFKSIYETNNSVFVGATEGNGKTQLAEFAIIKQLIAAKDIKKQQKKTPPILYICATDDIVSEKYNYFVGDIFAKENLSINIFTGQYTIDSSLFDKSDIIVTSYRNIEYFTRRMKKNKIMNLVIIDDIHLLGESDSCLEIAVTRMRYKQNNIRFIVLSTSLSNPNTLCEWLQIDSSSCFNFNPNVRQHKIEIFFYGYDSLSHKTRFNLMTKSIINQIQKHSYINNKIPLKTLVYVSSFKNAKDFLFDYLSVMASLDQIDKALMTKIDGFSEIVSKNIKDPILQKGLNNGIGFVDDSLEKSEIEFVVDLYKENVIQILVIPYNMLWKINCECHIAIVGDPVHYDGGNGWIDYSISDMYHIMGKACLTEKNEKINQSPRKCMIFFQNAKKEFYKKFLLESYPLESQLHHHLHNSLLVEICNEVIKDKQNCIDWLTWTYLYHRLMQNPNYYDMKGKSSEYLNEYLSELIEQTLLDLSQAGCIQINESDKIIPLNLGRISSFYNVSYNTIDLFNQSLHENSNKLSEMFQIIKNAYEYDYIEYNKDDIELLYDLASQLPQTYLGNDIRNAISKPELELSSYTLSDPHNKALILLLCYISRIPVPNNMHKILESIVLISLKLVLSLVDILSSKQFLKPALLAMELSQMIVQAMWITQSPLMQLPLFTNELCDKMKNANIEDIADFVNMNDEERYKIINVDEEAMGEIANVCNRYPSIDMNILLKDKTVQSRGEVNLTLELSRQVDEDEKSLTPVPSIYYPEIKEENWWVVVGNESTNELKAIKRINFFKGLHVNISFEAPENIGTYSYKVFLFCDSWIGCDMDDNFEFEVIE